jgi:hypothetical protein
VSNRIRSIVVIALALSGLSWAAPANAEDRRPCVSRREFQGARDFDIPYADPTSRTPPLASIGRRTLEEKWDVRHRGVTVSHIHDFPFVPVAVNPLTRVKMYRACGVSLDEAQVYVAYNEKSNMVFWTLWFRAPPIDQFGNPT